MLSRSAVAAVVIAVIAAVPSAAAGTNIDITGKDVAAIQEEIKNALGTGDVTVTGSVADIKANLNITVPEKRTLHWKAQYASANRISLGGKGNFIISDGGKIETARATTLMLSTGTNYFGGTLTVGTGGEIKAGGRSDDAGISGSGTANMIPTIIVDGGTINATGSAIAVGSGGGTGIVHIKSGTITGSSMGNDVAVNIFGKGRLAVSGGKFSKNTTSSGPIIRIDGESQIYLSGSPEIADGTIQRVDRETPALAGYYTGDNLAKFNTATGKLIFTAGENLHNNAPADWPK